jgi:hypothetical protein
MSIQMRPRGTEHTLLPLGPNRSLPKPYRDRPHWLAVARDIEAAARGGDAAGAALAIRMALLIEGVACCTK